MGILSAPWKLATLGAGLVAAVLGFLLFSAHMENRGLETDKNQLIARIEDPKTGYIARLTQANANVVTLKSAIDVQNARLREQAVKAEADKAELERLRKELAKAQAATRAMERRLASFMATKPQGATLEDRVSDIDRRILEDLNR